MAFDFGTDSVLLVCADSDAPPTPTTGLEPAWPTPNLAGLKVAGYSKMPAGHRGLNNSRGRAIGGAEAQYKKRGLIAPGINFQFCPGTDMSFMANCHRAEGVALPRVAIVEMVFGQWARIYRGCVCEQIEYDLGANGGQGGEVMINVGFQAYCAYDIPLPNFSRAALAGLGMPFFWHDVRTFNIADATGAVFAYRGGVSSAVLRCQHTLSRTNQRPNYGDSSHLARCSESIRETDIGAGGDITFNQRLSTAQFDGIVNAQDWGNLVTHISDAPAVAAGGKGFSLTATDLFPADETGGGGETGALRTYSVPVTARNLIFTPDA